MNVLVTGGTGFIGSHTCVELLKNNYEIIILDSLCNSSIKVLKRIEKILEIESNSIKSKSKKKSCFCFFNIKQAYSYQSFYKLVQTY